jgi:hypothetical protein
MRRLAIILGLLAVLASGAVLAGCPFFHGSYPSSKNECTADTDCFLLERCADGGVCEVPDAGGVG